MVNVELGAMAMVREIIKKNIILKRIALRLYYIFNFISNHICSEYYGKPIDKLIKNKNYNEKIEIVRKKLQVSPDKCTYFIIRRDYYGIGLFTYVCVVISYIAYAIAKGYVPVVDMKNYDNIYLEKKDVGIINAWELYYNQPFEVGLDDIPVGARCVYSAKRGLPKRTPFLESIINDKEELQLWMYIHRNCIKPNTKVKDYLNQEMKIIEGKTVLGILFRGTDYSKGKPKGHPIQPSYEQTIKKIEELLDEDEYIYLASEEKKIEDLLKQKFPNRVLINKRVYYDIENIDYKAERVASLNFEREDDRFLKGLEYMSSINILSNCNSFLGSGCAGTYVAVIANNGKYDPMYLWDLGYYD